MNAMVELDETRTAILTLTFLGQLSLDDVAAYTAAIERALDRAEPFGLIMLATEAYLASQQTSEASNATAKWLKEHKPRMQSYCVGIGNVVADEATRAAHAQVMETQGEKIYGTQVRCFASPELASDWLLQRVQAV